MQEGTETDWEHFCDDLFTVNEDTKQDLTRICKQGIFTMIQKHLFSSTYKMGPHADTHTNENKPRVLYWTLAAEERDELGVRVRLGT